MRLYDVKHRSHRDWRKSAGNFFRGHQKGHRLRFFADSPFRSSGPRIVAAPSSMSTDPGQKEKTNHDDVSQRDVMRRDVVVSASVFHTHRAKSKVASELNSGQQ